ncbi:hypothetical protein ACXYN8_08765 [Altererythrobacter sp. CAU 1778]
MRKTVMTIAAASLMAGSTIAQAAPVQADAARAGAQIEDSENLFGSTLLPIILAVAAAIVIIAVSSDDEDEFPYSP